MRQKTNRKLFASKSGIRLDIGCGLTKQKGFVGLDICKAPGVDIVCDIQKFPWPIPDNVCFQILMSHVFEHIEPKYRFQAIDECWRIIRHDGQLLISCPYANTFLANAHPAHYMCPNEAAFQWFDPAYPLYHCQAKKALPWRIVRCVFNLTGTIEVIMEPRKNKKNKPVYEVEKGEQKA